MDAKELFGLVVVVVVKAGAEAEAEAETVVGWFGLARALALDSIWRVAISR